MTWKMFVIVKSYCFDYFINLDVKLNNQIAEYKRTQRVDSLLRLLGSYSEKNIDPALQVKITLAIKKHRRDCRLVL